MAWSSCPFSTLVHARFVRIFHYNDTRRSSVFAKSVFAQFTQHRIKLECRNFRNPWSKWQRLDVLGLHRGYNASRLHQNAFASGFVWCVDWSITFQFKTFQKLDARQLGEFCVFITSILFDFTLDPVSRNMVTIRASCGNGHAWWNQIAHWK